MSLKKHYCEGCLTELTSATDEMCLDCTLLCRRLNKAPARPKTHRKCRDCGEALGPERYFHCRNCVKPTQSTDLSNEYYELSL